MASFYLLLYVYRFGFISFASFFYFAAYADSIVINGYIFINEQYQIYAYDVIHYKMRKIQFDRTRPFTIYKSYQQFKKLGSNTRQKQKKSKVSEDVVEVSKAEFTKCSQKKYQDADIIIPSFQVIPPLIRKPLNIESSYIRCSATYPTEMQYQLRESDIYFLKELRKQFGWVQEQFLQREIVQLQKRTGRQDISKKNIPNERSQYLKELKLRRTSLDQNQLIQIGNKVFNYWYNQRRIYSYPLYRPLWRPSPTQYDHHSAFRKREKQKRSLRRFNRVPEEKLIENLLNEFETAKQICQKVCQRQELKFTLTKAKLLEWDLQVQKQDLFPEDQHIFEQHAQIKQQLLASMKSSSLQESSSCQMDEQQIYRRNLKACKFIERILQQQKDEIEKSKTIIPIRPRVRETPHQRYNKFKDLGTNQYEQVQNECFPLHKAGSQMYIAEECSREMKEFIRRFNSRNRNQNSNN